MRARGQKRSSVEPWLPEVSSNEGQMPACAESDMQHEDAGTVDEGILAFGASREGVQRLIL
jgi:hypothetical protein